MVMVITTAAELLPGVIGLGVKLHSETAGPPEQDRVTRIGE